MPRGKMGGRGTDAATIKVAREAYDIARAVVAELSLDGWRSIGLERTDPPTIQAVIEEGIKQMAARVNARKKGR